MNYDEYTRRHEEWEARRAAGEFDTPYNNEGTQSTQETPSTEGSEDKAPSTEDDISW